MEQEIEIDVMIADASHEVYVDTILDTIESAAKVRGTGIAKRTHEYVAQKMKEGKAVGPFGVMGGYMQPQGHVQVAMNLIDFHLNPQMALDAPRWLWERDNRIYVEPHFPTALAKALQKRGHRIEVCLDPGVFGRGQMILRMENGTLIGGTESRTDSNIACF